MRAEEPIAAYVRELGPRLGGSWLRRRRIIAEVRAHLSEAVASDPLAEQDRAEAARRAIARFGTVEEMAQAFAAGRERGFRPGRGRLGIAAAAAVLVGAAIATPLLVLSSAPGPSQGVNLNAGRDQLHQAAQVCPITVVTPAGPDAAASYLGLTDAQLRAKLQAGESLAQVASERHKSVGGLTSTVEGAVKRDLRARLDAAAKRIPQADQAELRRGLSDRIDDVVNQLISRPRLGVPQGCPGHISGQPSF
jgi:hypothetical protein